MRRRPLFPRLALLLSVLQVHALLAPAEIHAGARLWRFGRDRADDIGSSHVAILSVAPWEEYLSVLQPRFEMDAQKALSQVAAFTGELATRRREELRVGASANLARSTFSESRKSGGADTTSATTTTEGETTTTGSTVTSETSSTSNREDSRTGGAPEDLLRDRIAAGADPALPGSAADPNPMAQHWNAAALYQEVNLLNRMMEDVALRTDARAYVVRMLVTLLPTRRDLSYDALTTLSFFSSKCGTPPTIVALASTAEARNAQSLCEERPVSVLPALVTDNMESVRAAADHATIRDLQLGIAAQWAGTGFRGNLEKHLENISRGLGRQQNSLMTLARISENSLRVRFGAVWQPPNTHVMVPRTHVATVVVFVDKSQAPTNEVRRFVRIVAGTQFVDAKGVVAKDRKLDATDGVFDTIDDSLERYDVKEDRDSAMVRQLAQAVENNDFAEFRAAFAKCKGSGAGKGDAKGCLPDNPDAMLSIWRDTASALTRSRLASAVFQLPLGPELKPVAALTTGRQPRDGQSLRAFLADRSKTAGCAAPADSSLSTGGPLALVDDEKEATIDLDASEWRARNPRILLLGCLGGKTLMVSPTQISAPSARTVRAVFRSPSLLLTPNAAATPFEPQLIAVIPEPSRWDSNDDDGWLISVVHARTKKLPPPPAWKFATEDTQLVAKGGAATLGLHLVLLKDTTVTAKGGRITGIKDGTGTDLKRVKGDWVVTTSGFHTLTLENLAPATPLTLTFTSENATVGTQEVAVKSAP